MRRRVAGLTPQSSVAPQSISMFRQSYHQRRRKQQAPDPHFSQGQLICDGYRWIGGRRRGPWHQRRWRRFVTAGAGDVLIEMPRARLAALERSEDEARIGLALRPLRLGDDVAFFGARCRACSIGNAPEKMLASRRILDRLERCGRPPMVDLPQSRPVQMRL